MVFSIDIYGDILSISMREPPYKLRLTIAELEKINGEWCMVHHFFKFVECREPLYEFLGKLPVDKDLYIIGIDEIR